MYIELDGCLLSFPTPSYVDENVLNNRKDDFIKLLKSSSFFLAVFDKNKDRIVTEVKFLL